MAEVGGIAAAVVYCHRNQAGGYWIPTGLLAEGLWTIYSPISPHGFVAWLDLQGAKYVSDAERTAWSSYIGGHNGESTQ